MLRATKLMLALLATGLMALPVSGCAPSDPEGPPTGLRVDQGNITVYVPLCPNERVVEAQVDLINDKGDGVTVWTGRSPNQPTNKQAPINATSWADVVGQFVYTGQEFSISIDGTERNYGTAILKPRVVKDPLPTGTYDTDGAELTSQQIDERSDCGS